MRQAKQDVRALFDSLEGRSLFAATPIAAVPTCALDDNNTLVISGTAETDRVDIRADDHSLLVRLNADGSKRKRFAPGSVNGVIFDGGGGSDSVTVNQPMHLATATERVEHRTVQFNDGTTTDDFATATQPGNDEPGTNAGTYQWFNRYRRQQKTLAETMNAGDSTRTLLIGDSLTERMTTQGREQFAALKAKYDVADLGFSGDTTMSLLYRLQHDLIKGLWPRTIFVSIGTNNIALTDDVASTVRGVRRVLQELQSLRPKSQLVLSSILPRGESAQHQETVDAVNEKLDDLAKEYDAVWSDAAAAFPDVKLQPRDFETNSVHLTRFGYAKWAPVIANSLHTAALRANLP